MGINSRLFMEVGFVNSTFQAIDKTPYSDWISRGIFDNNNSHAVMQRLIQVIDGDDSKQIDFNGPTVVSSGENPNIPPEELSNPYIKENLTNGLYYYQKLILPVSGDHESGANEYIEYVVVEGGEDYVLYVDEDSSTSETFDPISDFDEIYELVRRKQTDNCFYFDDYSLSIYDLIECYLLTERDRINNYLKNNCKGNCDNAISDIDARADILLAAIMVIKDLIEKEDFFEAQRILNGLNTCGNLCKKYAKNLNGCNCGGA